MCFSRTMCFCETPNDTGSSSPTIATEGYSFKHARVNRQSNVMGWLLNLNRACVSRTTIVPAGFEKEREWVENTVPSCPVLFCSGAIFSTLAALQRGHHAASLHLVEILVSLPAESVHRKTIPSYILRQTPYKPHPQHAICFRSFAHFLFISVHKSENTVIARSFGDNFTDKRRIDQDQR